MGLEFRRALLFAREFMLLFVFSRLYYCDGWLMPEACDVRASVGLPTSKPVGFLV